MELISIQKQEEILDVVSKILWQIKTDLLYHNATFNYEINEVAPKEKYFITMQNELRIILELENDGKDIKYIIIYNERFNHNIKIRYPYSNNNVPKIKGLLQTIKNYFEEIGRLYRINLTNKYQSLLSDIYVPNLIDYVNKYIAAQNIDYRVDSIHNIDWKFLFENITINSQFLDKLYFHINMKDYCQYGDVIWDLIDDADMFYLHFLFLNQKTSLQNKLDYIHATQFDNFDYITDEIIHYRNNNGVEVDDLLISYMENDLPINIEMLSLYYPLTDKIVTRFIDKLSLDNIMKNETIKNKYDIIILFKDKINQ